MDQDLERIIESLIRIRSVSKLERMIESLIWIRSVSNLDEDLIVLKH